MEEQEPTDFRFFRVLLPGFSEKMFLPRNFIKQIRNEKYTNTAIFLNPTGKVWHVDLQKEADGVYVGGKGWRDLTLANNLGVGYFLVLHYRGNLVFSFRAFDLSTCEIAYSSVGQKDARKESTSNNVEHENFNIVQEPAETSRKKQKTEGWSHAQDQKGQRFEVTIKECNLVNRRRCFVLIPYAFMMSCDHLMEVSKLTLKDPNGIMWPVVLFHTAGSHKIYISKGWLAFARANEVKVADRCIFELLPQRQNQVIMSVKILSNIPVSRPTKSWEGSTSSKESVEIL